MRLIDRNKLKYEKTIIQDSKYEEGDIVYWVSKDDIEKQPIVEAISVEWLKKYRDTRINRYGRLFEEFDRMIDDWELENETETNRCE